MGVGDDRSLLACVKKMKAMDWVLLVVALVVPTAGAFIGSRFSNTEIYRDDQILKPSWSPPPWLFAPVWTVLFLAMGAASFLVYKCGGGFNQSTVPALIIYGVKLIAVWLWTPLFFGLRLAGIALFDIGIIWALAVACIVTFVPVTRVGAALLLPYLAWVTFATALNYEIVRLNGAVLQPMSNGTVTEMP